MSLKSDWAALRLRGKLLVLTVLILGILSLIQIGGGATGKLCVAGVIGGSCSDIAPHGSRVLVFPLKAREGDLVYAWVSSDLDSPDQADHQPGRVVKRLRSGRLVSTASAEHYDSGYRILGRVVLVLHTERWFPWLNKGSQTPGRVRTVAEQKDVDDRKDALIKGHSAAERAKGLLRETSVILGPIETRPAKAVVPIPAGTKMVRWEMSVPPLMPEAKVRIKAGRFESTETIPADDPKGKNGGFKVDSQTLWLSMDNPARGCAVQVSSLRFYDH